MNKSYEWKNQRLKDKGFMHHTSLIVKPQLIGVHLMTVKQPP